VHVNNQLIKQVVIALSNQSIKTHYIAPYVGGESEAHVGLD